MLKIFGLAHEAILGIARRLGKTAEETPRSYAAAQSPAARFSPEFSIQWGKWPVESSTSVAASGPYRAIVSLQYKTAAGTAFGTGWLVSPSRLVTAKHVLLPQGLPYPPQALSAVPFGASPLQLNIASVRPHPSLDLATIEVAGNIAAALPVRAFNDAALRDRVVAVAGRPYIPDSGPVSNGLVWFSAPITETNSSVLEYSRLSTFESHSGSPVLAVGKDLRSYAVVGIHFEDQRAVRITPAVRKWLLD